MNDEPVSISAEETAFLERLIRWQDGALPPEERVAFERELAASEKKRRVFIEAHLRGAAIREHLRAEAYCGPEESNAVVPSTASSMRLRWREALAWALAACLALMFYIWLDHRPAPSSAPAAPVTWIATLVGQDGCEWADGAARLTGQRLPAGTLRLRRGTAVVRFDAGARLVVAGPAEFALESPGSARLLAGRVTVRAPEEAVGFRLLTPDGTAVDRGTEFVVSVSRSGGTECEVVQGEVEWHSLDQRARLARLTTGEARRFRSGRMETIAARGTLPLPEGAHTAAAGELLAYEPFDYPAGDLPAETLTGGFGWRSPWRGRHIQGDEFDDNPRLRIVHGGGLAFPGLAAPSGGGFTFHELRMWRLRQLATPVDFGRDGVHYFSWLLRRGADDPPSEYPSARVVLDLRSSEDYWSHWVSFAISSRNQPLILADGNNRVSDVTLPAGVTLLVVGKIATSRHGPDQLFMKVYQAGEPLDGEDPARWTVVSPELDFDLVADLVIPGIIGGGEWVMDELRHGTTWAAVLPPDPSR